MLSRITLKKHNIAVIITLPLQFFLTTLIINYELQKYKINHKHTFSVSTTLKHRFLKKKIIL